MIVEFILNIIWIILKPLLDLLPTLEINVTTNTFDIFLKSIKTICYIFPMGDVIIMIGIVSSITIFRIIISFIKTVWDLLPI